MMSRDCSLASELVKAQRLQSVPHPMSMTSKVKAMFERFFIDIVDRVSVVLLLHDARRLCKSRERSGIFDNTDKNYP